MSKQKEGGKTRKYGRAGRKRAAKGRPLSLYIRGKISGEQYFKLVGKSH